MEYTAPLKDMLFVVRHVAGLGELQRLPPFADATDDTVEAIVSEAARFSTQVVSPLNLPGDREHAHWNDGEVTTAKGFVEAFKVFAESGWQGLGHPPEVGGQGLPKLVATPCAEAVMSANLSFSLCPMLTDGAIEALLTAGTAAQKETFIPPMIEGRWTGTMNLTEAQAGSDLAQVRTRAEPQPDGSFRLFGQKIFITYGEHDLAENIIHLVLARTPGAPEGVKGISLFLVPKYLVDADGRVGARNDVHCASIEHKLGICASPTCVLLFGDGHGAVGAGAIGQLVGQENRGLEYMFIMMNAARFGVGLQGIAIAERAYQLAAQYARDRTQSRAVEGSPGPVPIIQHPDVRRMLMTMRALTEGCRAVAYIGAAAHDFAVGGVTGPYGSSAEAAAFYEFLVPLIKGFSTEVSTEVASIGVQVHGGMGFIEETGAAQHLRDSRILSIYEGTTAIQANDLLGRKTLRDGGALARAVVARARASLSEIESAGAASEGESSHADALASIARKLSAALDGLASTIDHLASIGREHPREAYAGSVPYLMQFGCVVAAWQLARSAAIASRLLSSEGADRPFLEAKIGTARFYAEHILPRAASWRDAILDGAESVLALDDAAY